MNLSKVQKHYIVAVIGLIMLIAGLCFINGLLDILGILFLIGGLNNAHAIKTKPESSLRTSSELKGVSGWLSFYCFIDILLGITYIIYPFSDPSLYQNSILLFFFILLGIYHFIIVYLIFKEKKIAYTLAIIGCLLPPSIWLFYILGSKRVKNTLIK